MFHVTLFQKNAGYRLAWAALGLALIPGPAAPLDSPKEAPAKAVKIKWLTPAEGLRRSKATGKPILYDFTAHWCGWCRRLDEAVFEKSKNAAKINKLFVPVVVMDLSREQGSNNDDVTELQGKYQVRGFPTLVVQYPNNGPSRQLAGFAGTDQTMAFLTQPRP